MKRIIYEQKIIDQVDPIPIDKLKELIEIAQNAICKIKYFQKRATGFFFQQNIPNIKYNKRYFLMTNNHVLNADSINNNDQILIEYKKKERYIPLNNRIKYTNKILDFTIIEILPEDSISSEIKSFFKIDEDIMNNNNKSNYLEQDICIFQHPKGGNLSYAHGKIKSINDDQIEYLVSTNNGSSGSPILLLNKIKIIGIHFGYYEGEEYNRATFMKNILDDINNNMFMIPQNRNYNNNMFIIPQNRNYYNYNMFTIPQNKNNNNNNNNKFMIPQYNNIISHNMIMIPQNKNDIYNNMLKNPQNKNDIYNKLFKISQNKNELTDISRKINNNKKRIRQK